MKRRRLLLILAIALAVAWTAWLAYQAYTTADPIVVSRPQVMAAPVVVVARLDDATANPCPAVITKVYRGENMLPPDAEAKQAKILVRGPFSIRGQREQNPGTYILPLRETETPGEFEVMPPPMSPGFRQRS